jgi:hypothetical protein
MDCDACHGSGPLKSFIVTSCKHKPPPTQPGYVEGRKCPAVGGLCSA